MDPIRESPPPPARRRTRLTETRSPGARRGVAVATGVGIVLLGIVVLVASIESIGLVGEGDTEVSWPLAIPGLTLLVGAPAVTARLRWSAWRARPSIAAYVAAAGAAALVGVASGSLALAAFAWLAVGLAAAVA